MALKPGPMVNPDGSYSFGEGKPLTQKMNLDDLKKILESSTPVDNSSSVADHDLLNSLQSPNDISGGQSYPTDITQEPLPDWKAAEQNFSMVPEGTNVPAKIEPNFVMEKNAPTPTFDKALANLKQSKLPDVDTMSKDLEVIPEGPADSMARASGLIPILMAEGAKHALKVEGLGNKDETDFEDAQGKRSGLYVDNLKKLGLSPDNYVQEPSANTDLGLSSMADGNGNPEDPNKSDADFYKQGGVGDPIAALNKLKSMTGGQSAGGSKAAPTNNTTPPTASAAPVDLSDREFAKAQEDTKFNRRLASIMEGANKIGGSVAGLGAGAVIADDHADTAKRDFETANNPITDLTTKRKAASDLLDLQDKKAKNDPNSDVSKAMRDAMKQSGMNVADSATYGSMEKMFPVLMHHQDMQAKIAEMLQAKQLGLAQIQATREATAATKASDKADKQVIAGLHAVDSYRGEPDIGALKKRMQNVEGTLSTLGDPNTKWTEPEKQMVQQEISAFLHGKSPTDADARHQYKSLVGDATQLESYFTGNPEAMDDPATKQRLINLVTNIYNHHADTLNKRDAKVLLDNGYDKWTDSAKAIAARSHPDAVSLLESGANLGRPSADELRGVSKASVVTPDGTIIPMKNLASAQAFIKDHPELKLKR